MKRTHYNVPIKISIIAYDDIISGVPHFLKPQGKIGPFFKTLIKNLQAAIIADDPTAYFDNPNKSSPHGGLATVRALTQFSNLSP